MPAPQPLTGADNFQVLLDRHMRKRGRIGNVVRLVLELDPSADLQTLAHGIANSPTFSLAVSLRMVRATLTMPKWVARADAVPAHHITLHTGCSAERYAAIVLGRDLSVGPEHRHAPVHVDLVAFDHGGKQLVIAGHHALFDRQGMVQLAKAIQPGGTELTDRLFPERTPQGWAPEFANTVYIMFYMLGSPFWFMARLLRGKVGGVSAPVFNVIELGAAEAESMERRARVVGSRFGNGSFHLAATLNALQRVFDRRDEKPPYYWVSMPVSKRRKGGSGHLFSNNLTFVFARLKAEVVRDMPAAVRGIQDQMKKQVGAGVPERYTSLLNFFRQVPLWLYSTLVNLPMRGDYASLSFSDLGQEGEGITSFGGIPVLSVTDYASVPAPPGLTVTFRRHGRGAQVVIGAVPEALSASEREQFHRDLVALLTSDAPTSSGS